MAVDWNAADILDPAGMRARRENYFRFVRGQGRFIFCDDGTYQPTTEPDGRIPYWILPAFLAASATDNERELGLRAYAQAAGWAAYDIFMTSCVAANMARHQAELTPELRTRSEEHLARFTIAADGREASAGIYDYMFHGYNDNMPSMATRTMVLAGDILGRSDFTDQGLFNLEGLCAHLQRRGLLSEYTSGTYTPISLCATLDIAECSQNAEARELAAACANRIALDLLAHWHWETGSAGGSMSRAYTTDTTETLSNLNAYIWYLSGHPLTISPIDALKDDSFPGPMHHHRNRAFCTAQFVEVMNASHETLSPGLREHAKTPRTFPYTIRATTDWGESGPAGGSNGYLSRSFQRRQWWLATASMTGTGSMTGQHLLFHGTLAAQPEPRDWTDRIAFWHRMVADHPDQGETVEASWGGAEAHRVALADDATRGETVVAAEADHVHDVGRYITAQSSGSAMLVGSLAPDLDGNTVSNLRFSLFFGTFLKQPDELFENDEPLTDWDGPAAQGAWQFMRFGEVYVGARVSAMVHGDRKPVRRVTRHRYMRIEAGLIDDTPTTIDAELRRMADVGFIFEIADREEVGSFAAFRKAVMATSWEYYHSFNRNARFMARHGELQISDSATRNTARFIAVDGAVEQPVLFDATGLDPALVELFPDGRRIVQRRICYRPDYLGSPYYTRGWQTLEADPMPG